MDPARGEHDDRSERVDGTCAPLSRRAEAADSLGRQGVTPHSPHPPEERLFEGYISERAGEAMNPRLADHLAFCAACRTRFGELAAFFDELRSAAAADVEMVFGTERLRA